MNPDNGNLSSLVQQVTLSVFDDSDEQDNDIDIGGGGGGGDNADDGTEVGDPAGADDENVGHFGDLID